MKAPSLTRPAIALSALAGAVLIFLACTEETPRLPDGRFVQVACLDVNGDRRISADDASGAGDEALAQAVSALDIALLPDAPADCANGGPQPELQFNEPTRSAEIACEQGEPPPLLIIGVGGGAVNLRDKTNAAGTRAMQAALQDRLSDRGVQSRAIATAPGVHNVDEPNGPMERVLAAIARYHLDTYPCLLLVLLGHSHGAVTATAVASALERDGYAGRIVATVPVDRISGLYTGDAESLPQQSPVFNVFETNEALGGGPLPEQPNVENWDASGEKGPEKGEQGGPLKQVNHTTIDNSKSVRDRIVDEVIERYDALSD